MATRRRDSVAAKPMPAEYEIIDQNVKPDALGNLGTARIYDRDGKRFVRMTREQAQWYLEHKTIASPGTVQPAEAPAPQPARRVTPTE